MIEGWYADEYLVVFADSEVGSATERYGISEVLPGFKIVGLRGWDDFIVRSPQDATFTLPTIRLDSKYLASYQLPDMESAPAQGVRFVGHIKWHVKPIVFSGDPKIGENIIWVDHEQHAQLVCWWNRLQHPSVTSSEYGGAA